MITEDYVSFETAKLLKEKGFNERCFSFYWSSGELDANSHDKTTDLRNSTSSNLVAPTLQMAMKWLKIEYNLHIEISPDVNDRFCFYPRIYRKGNESWEEIGVGNEIYDSYFEEPEKAEEAGIKYCLENLT